ncbi:hypothetical protein L596_001173 [Steinernema carpocapsae]|uniref:Uncharacterized protein n=1 Tax=Steinernema carpocapsae TaxID=34508 RepID=A0A4U8UL12_STECR|nr:hypothetical protein L596_001173 [Steinernema carpocapsae]
MKLENVPNDPKPRLGNRDLPLVPRVPKRAVIRRVAPQRDAREAYMAQYASRMTQKRARTDDDTDDDTISDMEQLFSDLEATAAKNVDISIVKTEKGAETSTGAAQNGDLPLKERLMNNWKAIVEANRVAQNPEPLPVTAPKRARTVIETTQTDDEAGMEKMERLLRELKAAATSDGTLRRAPWASRNDAPLDSGKLLSDLKAAVAKCKVAQNSLEAFMETTQNASTTAARKAPVKANRPTRATKGRSQKKPRFATAATQTSDKPDVKPPAASGPIEAFSPYMVSQNWTSPTFQKAFQLVDKREKVLNEIIRQLRGLLQLDIDLRLADVNGRLLPR